MDSLVKEGFQVKLHAEVVEFDLPVEFDFGKTVTR
jgi:hypothetical protein